MISDICGVSLIRENAEGHDSANLDNCGSHTPHSIRSAQRYFAGSLRYGRQLNEIVQSYNSGLQSLATALLSSLPTEKTLLLELCDTLKDKSVGKSLKKLMSGEHQSPASELKTWSSVMTHTAIEIERGNVEYRQLLPRLYEKIGSILGDM